jgi:hypothetical protein
MTSMNEKHWIIFKYQEESVSNLGRSIGLPTFMIIRKIDDKFLIWNEVAKDYSWTDKLDKATRFNRSRAKMLASMYLGVADIHPEIRYAD